VFKCEKPEAKSWDEIWKSGEVDKNQDALQATRKEVRKREERGNASACAEVENA
jgi:hypothetical protein